MYEWVTTALPLIAPSSVDDPSPQSTVTAFTALPFVVAGVTAIVNDAGRPAFGGDVGGVMTMVGAAATLTVTLADACPDADGVVGVVPVVGVPVAGGVVDELPTPTLAVTVAVCAVVSVVDAMPPSPVLTTPALSVPAVVVNVTGTPLIKLPLTSNTVAEIVVEPPSAGTLAGLALTTTFCTAALPTRIFSAPLDPTDAPPEIAVIVAVPDDVLVNVAVAWPLELVVASLG